MDLGSHWESGRLSKQGPPIRQLHQDQDAVDIAEGHRHSSELWAEDGSNPYGDAESPAKSSQPPLPSPGATPLKEKQVEELKTPLQ